ncbi:patatin-like phospholipase family protein [Streptomyces sp. NPDC007095]|uniref:patatin-like phospholipase family protein n=1 Tax=Streptomyces sp. NPDC007095 TaxID=3154482 RepID=UPI0033C2CAA3
MDTENDQGIGVSLSGGGHRATLFSLGALLALVDLGLQEKVRWISSVSGGSIANAYVANKCEYAETTSDDFQGVCREAVDKLSRHGSLTGGWRGRVRWILFAMGLTLSVVGVILGARAGRFQGFSLAFVSYVAGLLIWRLRGWLVELGIRDAWCRSQDGTPRALGGTERSVEHIFCAVDVRRAQPVFLSDSYVAEGYWVHRMKNLPTARAVRASAAFPGLLPPVRLRLDRIIDWEKGNIEHRSRNAFLVDGGVYNNLATEWTKRLATYDHYTDGFVLQRRHAAPVSTHLVIDASAPRGASSRLLHEIPVFGSLYTLMCTYNATYESTLSAARGEYPRGRGEATIVSAQTRPGWGNLVPSSIKTLNSRGWRTVAWTTTATKTTLSRIRKRNAIRIVAHGYALTLGALVPWDERKQPRPAWSQWLAAGVEGSFRDGKAFGQEYEYLRRIAASRLFD